MNDFYHIRRFEQGIDLCFVHIPSFAAAHIPDLDLSAFRRQRQRVLSETGPLSRFFPAGDFQRINSFKALKKQVEWMAGKAAVKILAHERGLGPCHDIRIAAEPGGAPYLPDFPGLPVSISHSGDYAACALGEPNGRVALDIEQIETGRMQSIVRVAFSEREIRQLQGQSDEAHYLAWTMKEAFLKYIRMGFAEGLKKVEILDGRLLHHGQEVSGVRIHSEIFDETYALTLMCGDWASV